MRNACQADLVGKPLKVKGYYHLLPHPPPMFSMAWPSENYICVSTDVAVIHRVIHRLPLLLISILLFQGKKTVVQQWLKYGYGEQSRVYGEQSRVKSEQSRVKRVDKTEARF